MTEEEWLADIAPFNRIDFLVGKVSNRKVRLYAVACCRRVPHLLNELEEQSIDIAERYADDSASKMELSQKRHAVRMDRGHISIAWQCARPRIWRGVREILYGTARLMGVDLYSEWIIQSNLVRDIFGNPFRPQPVIDSSWLSWNDGIIPKLAQAIYDDRAFDRLPILADALEEGGCTNADILNHCRQPGEHVRGCWVVDLLLGKS